MSQKLALNFFQAVAFGFNPDNSTKMKDNMY